MSNLACYNPLSNPPWSLQVYPLIQKAIVYAPGTAVYTGFDSRGTSVGCIASAFVVFMCNNIDLPNCFVIFMF